MNRDTTILSVLALLMAGVGTVAAQESEPEEGDSPQQPGKGMHMKEGMGMQQMMPMMMQMHRQHMMNSNAWRATEDAVFMLRGSQLVKYDKDLNPVKTVDLPGTEQPKAGMMMQRRMMRRGMMQQRMMRHRMHQQGRGRPRGGPGQRGRPEQGAQVGPMMNKQRMQQMMSRMHARLPRELQVTDNAVYVSQGQTLLKYDHGLEMIGKADLPEPKGMSCPMCKQMMQHMMNGADQKNTEDETERTD